MVKLGVIGIVLFLTIVLVKDNDKLLYFGAQPPFAVTLQVKQIQKGYSVLT